MQSLQHILKEIPPSVEELLLVHLRRCASLLLQQTVVLCVCVCVCVCVCRHKNISKIYNISFFGVFRDLCLILHSAILLTWRMVATSAKLNLSFLFTSGYDVTSNTHFREISYFITVKVVCSLGIFNSERDAIGNCTIPAQIFTTKQSVYVNYSGTSEQETLWGQQFCPL